MGRTFPAPKSVAVIYEQQDLGQKKIFRSQFIPPQQPINVILISQEPPALLIVFCLFIIFCFVSSFFEKESLYIPLVVLELSK